MTAVLPAPGFADPARDAQRAFRAVLDALARPARPCALDGPAEPPAALGRGLAAVALTLLDEDCTVWLGGALGRDAEVAAWLAFHTGARVTGTPGTADFVITAPDALPPLASLALGTDEAPHLSATVVLDIRDRAAPTESSGPAESACGPVESTRPDGLTAPKELTGQARNNAPTRPTTPPGSDASADRNGPARGDATTGPATPARSAEPTEPSAPEAFNGPTGFTVPAETTAPAGTGAPPKFSASGQLTGAARFTARGPGIDGAAALAAPWAPAGFAAAWQRNTELFPRGVDLLLVDSGTVTGLPRTTTLTEAER